MIAGMAHSIP